MTEVFADSFYWIALLNPADAFHDTVRRAAVSGRIVTSAAVQLEVLDAFSAYPALRPAAIRFWERTTHDPQVTVIPLTADVMQDSIDLFKARDDKTWSFTDCISFEIMRRRAIALALSADHHFRQAGFQTAFVT
ncbi:MAG: PIN domain-containing protein [Thermoguttaceae bacterium]